MQFLNKTTWKTIPLLIIFSRFVVFEDEEEKKKNFSRTWKSIPKSFMDFFNGFLDLKKKSAISDENKVKQQPGSNNESKLFV